MRHARHADERALRGAGGPGFVRWRACGLCEQKYHGVVCCALGWACWKTYVGRPETDPARVIAMGLLGNGLYSADRFEEALCVEEARVSTLRRLGASENSILEAQINLAMTYGELGHMEKAVSMERDVYSGELKLYGEENESTLISANNYSSSLIDLQRFKEVKSVLRKMTPVARRVLGENHEVTLQMRCSCARTLYENGGATIDDLRKAVTMLEEIEPDARRALGGAHPLLKDIRRFHQYGRAALAKHA